MTTSTNLPGHPQDRIAQGAVRAFPDQQASGCPARSPASSSIDATTAPAAIVHTDGLNSYAGLATLG